MQSENEHSEIVHTEVFNDQNDLKERLLHEMNIAESKGAVSHTLGKLPEKGETVEIYGLKYNVVTVNHKYGILHLKMKKEKEQDIK